MNNAASVPDAVEIMQLRVKEDLVLTTQQRACVRSASTEAQNSGTSFVKILADVFYVFWYGILYRAFHTLTENTKAQHSGQQPLHNRSIHPTRLPTYVVPHLTALRVRDGYAERRPGTRRIQHRSQESTSSRIRTNIFLPLRADVWGRWQKSGDPGPGDVRATPSAARQRRQERAST